MTNLAASVVVLRQAQALLVLRAKTPNRGVWSFPGGRLLPDEPPCVGARRELREETGLVVGVLAPLGIEQARRWQVHVFLATLAPNLRPRALSDAMATCFVSARGMAALSRLTPRTGAWMARARLVSARLGSRLTTHATRPKESPYHVQTL